MAIAQPSSRITALTDDTHLYESVPLPLENHNASRLLEIVKDDDDKPIFCRLHSACLDDSAMSYTALSYMWGEDGASKNITVNGINVRIRPNLWEFLSQLRRDQVRKRSRRPLLLWIDALCIDQGNIPERNHQVGIMSRIYSEAEMTLIWLGPAVDRRAKALRALSKWQRSGKFEGHASVDSELGTWLQSLCSHPYWTRAWIVQECVLAKRLKLQLGKVCMSDLSWPVITKFSERVAELGKDIGLETPAMRILELREGWHNTARRHYILPSANLLRKLECLDPRDRIYAMLSFIDPAISIKADYSKSAAELFVELVDRCKERFVDPREVYQLARTLELNSDEDLRLPGEDWPILVALEYDKIATRLPRHLDEDVSEGLKALRIRSEDPLAWLRASEEDERFMNYMRRKYPGAMDLL